LTELNEFNAKIEVLNNRKIETKEEQEYVRFMKELLQTNIKKIRERIAGKDSNKKIKFISV